MYVLPSGLVLNSRRGSVFTLLAPSEVSRKAVVTNEVNDARGNNDDFCGDRGSRL